SEANVLAVDALGNACVTIQQEGTQPEQLEFLRAFLAAADDPQVIEFAARGSLLESKPVGFESEVGLPKKGRNYADHEGKHNPFREEKDGRREAEHGDDFLNGASRLADQACTVGALDARAVHLVVERRILEGSQVQGGCVLHHPQAGVMNEAVG